MSTPPRESRKSASTRAPTTVAETTKTKRSSSTKTKVDDMANAPSANKSSNRREQSTHGRDPTGSVSHNHQHSHSHQHEHRTIVKAKTPAQPVAPAAKFAPAAPLTPAALRPNTWTAHTQRAMRKSAGMSGSPVRPAPISAPPPSSPLRPTTQPPTSRASSSVQRPVATQAPAPSTRASTQAPAPSTRASTQAPALSTRASTRAPAPPTQASTPRSKPATEPAVYQPRLADTPRQAPKPKKQYAPGALVPTSAFVNPNSPKTTRTTPGRSEGNSNMSGALVPRTERQAQSSPGGDLVGRTVGGVTSGVGNTLGAAVGGVGKTLGDTTGALGRGDVLGTVGGLTGGLGQTVGGVGKGLVSFSLYFLSAVYSSLAALYNGVMVFLLFVLLLFFV
ncbi:hypothetical protein B0H67DRAFT_179357 [Lasiosphaeris hirsuta]|uniref:Uncharacterized protein n=1 Tax=Lasiosphaeris hirsuta TaxID=260670 RepID=A0AA40AQL7_9PEZI|nr:hypothetical protein B0H67DRAFT_179357 [Lasiosphaeris hirsuta]